MNDQDVTPPAVPPVRDASAQCGYVSQNRTRRRPFSFGGFIMTFIIMDVVFSALRLVYGTMGLGAFSIVEKTSPLYATLLPEVLINYGMGILGLIAAIMILNKKRAGIPFGWIKVVFAAAGLVVATWQGVLQFEAINPAETPEGFEVGFVLGAVGAAIVRAGLLICYAIALKKAAEKLDARDALSR
jgi:hypothetical protein